MTRRIVPRRSIGLLTALVFLGISVSPHAQRGGRGGGGGTPTGEGGYQYSRLEILANGFNWQRYRVQFANGPEVGDLDGRQIEPIGRAAKRIDKRAKKVARA